MSTVKSIDTTELMSSDEGVGGVDFKSLQLDEYGPHSVQSDDYDDDDGTIQSDEENESIHADEGNESIHSDEGNGSIHSDEENGSIHSDEENESIHSYKDDDESEHSNEGDEDGVHYDDEGDNHSDHSDHIDHSDHSDHSEHSFIEGETKSLNQMNSYDESESRVSSSVRRSASLSPPRTKHFDDVFEPDYNAKLSEDDSSYVSSDDDEGSIDTFGCDGTSEPTETHKNNESLGTSDDDEYELGAFLEMHENDTYDPYHDENSQSAYRYDDENSYGGGYSLSGYVSIMSRNSVPFSIQEERSGDEEESEIFPAPTRFGRPNAVVNIEQAYEVLADEYLKLMDTLEEVEEMQDRRKSEKSRLTRVLVSKEEEYQERKDRLERMLARIEKLELQLLDRPPREVVNPETDGMQKMLKRSQTEAWESLNNALTTLEKHRETNRQLIEQLERRPEVDESDIELYLQRSNAMNNVGELEEELEALRKEVSHLRGRKKAKSTRTTLIGAEIIVGDDDDRSAISIGPLTFASADYR